MQAGSTLLTSPVAAGADTAHEIARQMSWARFKEHAGGILLTGYLILCAVPALLGIFAILSSLFVQ